MIEHEHMPCTQAFEPSFTILFIRKATVEKLGTCEKAILSEYATIIERFW